MIIRKFLSSVCILLLAQLMLLISCAGAVAEKTVSEDPIDYAAALRPGDNCLAVTVCSYVDGDTTHFFAPNGPDESGIVKARYLACNTPESTGKIEEYGKAASAFTRSKLETAESILIESDNGSWNHDSTGTRYLVWVWYRPFGEKKYRNLNIELLQNGFAIANSSAQNRYGDTCMAAIAQARSLKLNIYSGLPDPDFYYGDAIEVTLRELRLHPTEYEGKKVAFTGVITVNHNNAVYLESYDAETDMYYGITAYYGFNMSGGGLEVLHVGNEARIVGTMQYYEAGQSWQISGMNYRMMKPDDPGNIRMLSQGHDPSWKETDPEAFNSQVTISTDDGEETYLYAELAVDTSVSVTGYADLIESDISELICLEMTDCGEDIIRVYAPQLISKDGRPLSNEDLEGHVVQVRGFVRHYEDIYCIRIYSQDGFTFLD